MASEVEPGTGKYLAAPPWSVGNWRIDNEAVSKHWTDSLSIMDANGGEVCVLTRGYESDPETGGCPSWQNARLIAATPELLAALKQIDSKAVGSATFDEVLCALEECRRIARAAIAKASR
jgi:hypothetical protein